MQFDFTQDAKDLAAGAAEFLTGEYTPSYVRSVWDGEVGHDAKRWRQLAETGFVGVAIPEEHGGLGMGDVELTLLLEQAGRANVTEPLLEVAAIAAPTIADYGADAIKAEWLPRIASGDTIVAVQLGGAPLVVDAEVAEALLVEVDGVLHLTTDFTATPQASLDKSRRVATVEASTSEATRLTEDPAAAARAFDRGAAATAAWLNGLSLQLLEMSVAYVKEREQFGRPVGSFQAVKHLLAETVLEAETSRAATWYAAYAVHHDADDRVEAVSVAKSFASDAARTVNTNALQAFGGIGFTWEHDLHLWLKRGKALEGTYGTASFHRDRIAALIFDRE